MRFYYVDKRDVALIGQANVEATALFAFASFFLSIWLDVTSGLAFSSGEISAEAKVLNHFRPWSLVVAILLALLGAYKLYTKGAWWRVLREEHGEDIDIWGNEKKSFSDDASEDEDK